MDYQTIAQLIGSLGFPIFAACGMFYLYDKTIKELTITMAKVDITLQHLSEKIYADKSDGLS